MEQANSSISSAAEPPRIPSTKGITSKVFKGGLWTLLGQVLPLFASLLATPFVIRFLGAEQYGVFALINLLLTYLTFADFGMGLASTSFASEAYADGDEDKEAKVVRTAALIALLSSVLTSLSVILLAHLIVRDLLKVPPHLQETAVSGIYLASGVLVARVLSGVLNSPQLARLRMDLNSTINAVFNIAQIILVPVVIFFGGGILGAVATVLAAAVGALITHILVSGRLLKTLFEASISRRAFWPLLRFGWTLVVSLVAWVLLANLEKVILTRYASVTAFAYYSVAFTLANMVTLFSSSMAQSLVPAFSQLYSTEKHNELQDLYTRAITFNLILFAPVAMLLCLIARPFFTVWAGEDFGRESTGPFYIMIAGLLFNFSVSVSGTVFVASRKTHVSAYFYWLELVPYLFLTTVLTYYWGAMGAALAWSLRIFFEAGAFLLLVKKLVGVSFHLFDRKMAFLTGSFVFLLVPLLLSATIAEDPYYLWTGGATLTGLLLYGAVVWQKVFSIEEKDYLKRLWRNSFDRYFGPGALGK